MKNTTRLLILFLYPAVLAAEPLVEGVQTIRIPVADMERSLAFYQDLLDFNRVSEGVSEDRGHGSFKTVTLGLGEETIELVQYLSGAGQPVPADSRSNDLWFQHIAIITRDISKAENRLREKGDRFVSQGAQRLPDWNPNAGGISAFYFLDPDGHALEILQFPEGKGLPKWQEPGANLFLGVDHTAIAVSDTEKSLAFYSDTLGLRVAGTSENYGPEQERLNNVPGAHVRITALRGDFGPGVELLEYLHPSGGRPYPAEAEANDLFAWQIELAATNAPTETLLRDPDGHFIHIQERKPKS